MNRLEQESSPYLRQHADNPVDWYPWGPEALELAKKLDKPILLSVGYSACHWCHVMAHESFEDEACARLMNERFINVKVDREERPDLDQIYQGVVQLLGRGGGWPLTVFLTPDLRPFYGGTYFPPEDRYGMPSFQKVLHALSDAYQNQRGEIESQAEQFKAGLGELAVHGLGTGAEAIKPEDVARAGVLLATEVDRVNGGFGSAPKFPSPMSVALLLRAARREPSSPAREAALLTLRKMANGGVYDQLGGGFHRYSVDAKWLVPHFEKMLYDNAQLLHLYAEAYQCEPDPLFARVVEETVVYLQREMTSPQGGFFATQDADSEGEEGKFFVWGRDEALALLTPEEGEAFAQRYSLTASGNFEHGGRNVLEVVDASVDANDARLVSARQKLFAARALRVAPGRDDKVLTGWNGLMIRGLAFASRVFARPEWAALAARAADFLLATAWKDGRLTRVFQEGRTKIAGFVEDYGDLALGLTDLYQATFEPRYLAAAREVAAAAQALFWDEERKAYRSAPKGQADLVAEVYALHDNAVPSGASTLTHAQVTLSALLADAPLLEHARVYLERLKKDMGRNPFAYGHLWLAADALVDGAAELTVVGSRAETAPFVARVNRTYAPTLAVLAVDPDGAVHPVLAEAVKERTRVKGKAAAYLCRHFACELPVTEVDSLRW